MKAMLKAAALLSFAMLGACEVNVDENVGAAAEQAVSDAGNGIEAAVQDAQNATGAAGEAIGNGVQGLDNQVDVDVNLNADGNEAAER